MNEKAQDLFTRALNSLLEASRVCHGLRMSRKDDARAKRSGPRMAQLAAALIMSALLSSCFGGMMIVAAGLSMEEAKDKREAERREKRLSKLPPDAQAMERLWYVRNWQHGTVSSDSGYERSMIDERTGLAKNKAVILTRKKQEILKTYDDHFAKFGWQRVRPPAAQSLRSYVLNDYRVDIGMVTPSRAMKPGPYDKDPQVYTDLITSIYSPREDAPKKSR